MTPWCVLSVLAWIGWIWSIRYLFHSDLCDCERCCETPGWSVAGIVAGISTLIVLMFAGIILWDHARWLAFMNFLPPWFTFMEMFTGNIFWSRRRWIRHSIRRWCYDGNRS